MKFDTKEAYHAVVFTPKGKMMGGPDNAKFHDAVKTYIDQGKKNFVVDLGNVDWMNSPGLGVLITDHSVRETLRITDRAYIMADGKILIEGTAIEKLRTGIYLKEGRTSPATYASTLS